MIDNCKTYEGYEANLSKLLAHVNSRIEIREFEETIEEFDITTEKMSTRIQEQDRQLNKLRTKLASANKKAEMFLRVLRQRGYVTGF